MDEHTQEALRLCKLAITEFKAASFKDEKWRLRWVNALTLLRLVLHVHKKHNKYSENFFNNKKEEYIFKEFIKKERDLLLKECVFKSVSIKNIILFRLESEKGNAVEEDIISMEGFKLPVHKLIDQAVLWIENYLVQKIFICSS
jgi:hypothetical protein